MRELGFQELFARNCSSRVVIWSWQLGDFEESYKSSFILHIYIYIHTIIQAQRSLTSSCSKLDMPKQNTSNLPETSHRKVGQAHGCG